MELELNIEPINVGNLIKNLEEYDLDTKFDYNYSLYNDDGLIMVDYNWNKTNESTVKDVLEYLRICPNDSILRIDIEDGYKYADIIGVRFDAYYIDKLTFVDSCYK